MRQVFEMELPRQLEELMMTFWNTAEVYIVGGAVRDALLGKTPKDFDLATSLHPGEVERLLKADGYPVDITGKSFGVVRTRVDDMEFEIATFRRDIGEGRRPDSVEFTTIEEDVKRRDLTINALFYDTETSEVVDLVGGLKDLENRRVRFVGNAHERIREDPLRVLRAVRFAARLETELDHETERVIRNTDLTGVSRERIRDEFIKGLAQARSTVHFLTLLERCELFERMFFGLQGPDRQLFREHRSLPVQLALLFNGQNLTNSIEEVLQSHTYTREEVRKTMTLIDLGHWNHQGALRMKRKVTTSRLSDDEVRDYVGFVWPSTLPTVEALLRWVPSINGQILLDEGFSGAELGVELERRAEVEFQGMLERPKEVV